MKRCMAILGLVSVGGLALCNDVPQANAVRLEVAPSIDGVFSEGEWSAATRLTGFQDQFTSKIAEENTIAWIGYDDDAIYVAFHCFDSKPNEIVAKEVQPGSEMDGDDLVYFVIGPFNQKIDATVNTFYANPLGTKTEEIAGGRAGKTEWRGEWQAASTIAEDGWICEMRIPWEVLSYPKGEKLTMALDVARMHERTKIFSEWANTTPQGRMDLLGDWTSVTPPAAKLANPLQTLVFVSPEFDEDAKDEWTVRSGVDLRYRFTSQLTGIASINPDFRNIEQEIEDNSFSRSERFVGDARPFFKEGTSLFDLSSRYGFGRMFFSRRIGEFDQGLKVYGNVSDTERVGALATRTSGVSNAGVFSYWKSLSPRSDFNIYSTTQTGSGENDQAYGGSFYYGTGNWDVDLELAHALDNGVEDGAGSVAVGFSTPKLFATVRGYYVEPDFSPPLALIPFTDKRGAYLFSEYVEEIRDGPVRVYGADIFLQNFETYAGANHSRSFEVNSFFETRDDMGFSLGYESTRFLDEEERFFRASAGMNVTNRFKQIGIEYEVGEIDGTDAEFILLQAKYRVAQGVDIGIDYSVFDFGSKDDLSIFALNWEIDERQSVSARYIGRNSDTNFSLAYSSSGFTGMEWFVIVGDPNANTWRDRVAVKVVWSF